MLRIFRLEEPRELARKYSVQGEAQLNLGCLVQELELEPISRRNLQLSHQRTELSLLFFYSTDRGATQQIYKV